MTFEKGDSQCLIDRRQHYPGTPGQDVVTGTL